MIRIVTFDFHSRFLQFFNKIKNIELIIVDISDIVQHSIDTDYVIVPYLSLEEYKKIKCKKILIDVFPAGNFTELLKYASFDIDTVAIVFATYNQLINFGFRNSKKVHVINWAIDVVEWPVWIGGVEKILGVCKDIKRPICGESVWNQSTLCLPKTQIGCKNDYLSENIGFKTENELKEYYKTYNVFFHHTTTSPAPNVLLEAMTVGIPIVSYDNWFVQEHLNYRGFISNNIDELKHKLCELIYKNESRFLEYGILNREYVKANFSPDLFYYKWQKLLK